MKLTLAWLAPAKSNMDRFSRSCMELKNWSNPLLMRVCGCAARAAGLSGEYSEAELVSELQKSFNKTRPPFAILGASASVHRIAEQPERKRLRRWRTKTRQSRPGFALPLPQARTGAEGCRV